jgi:excisionase family DNA binding protein
MMNKETMIARLLNATPAELKKVAAVFNGEATEQAEVADRKLLSIQQTAAAMGVSRTTVWRLLKAGRLPFIELRPGSRRVPSAAITELVRKGVCA